VTLSYEDFVARKLAHATPTGIEKSVRLGGYLFPFQKDLVRWALRRGRAAIFASTGLGKTRQELEWARVVASHTKGRILLLAPLAVAAQTAEEASRIGIDAKVAREASDIDSSIVVTNYDRLHKFDPSAFTGVVLDESSVIKHHDAKTFGLLCEAFGKTAFRLCATATPAPNDYTELGTHAEFLGICSRAEMLAEYFVHDGGSTQDWRLKGHARSLFWRWVASWGALVRSPRDLGYDDGAYALPPLNVNEHIMPADTAEAFAMGRLFVEEAAGLSERRSARKASVGKRVAACAKLVNSTPGPHVVWCDLNAESDALASAIDGAVEVRGSQTTEEKESTLAAFARGDVRVLISKPSICGWGLNWQHCHQVSFVGVTDSWEAYYQAVRRCWRFGQKSAVDVYIFASEAEGAVVANLQRKERDAIAMSAALSDETSAIVRSEVRGSERTGIAYDAGLRVAPPSWLKTEGDA
jgi:superfamily II DNA or RNA helicase